MLWHLGRTCSKHFCGPPRTGQTAEGKGLQLLLNVVVDPPDRGDTVCEEQIGCARIAIVGKSNAAGVDQESRLPSKTADERPMGMPKGNDRLAKRTIECFQFRISRIR